MGCPSLATGAKESKRIGVEDLSVDGVYYGLEFLKMGVFFLGMKKSMIFFNKPRNLVFSLFFLFFFPFLVGNPSNLDEKGSLTYKMDLADWGFKDASEVGYLSVGIYHKDSGDELVVYDVRRKKPVIELPAEPKGRIPPIQKRVFLLDDFHQGNTNRLGGYFSSIIRAPSESHVTIDKAPDGRQSLCFAYNQKSPGFAGFWIHLFDFKLPPIERTFLDVTPFQYITFDIRGEEGGERLKLQVADYVWERKEDSLTIGNMGQFLPSGNIQKKWQRAWVPLTKLPVRIKREELANLVFLAQSGRGKVYIGDVALTEAKDAPIPRPVEKKTYEPSPHRGMWLWNTKDLLGHDAEQIKLADFCGQSGITEIFLQLPYEVMENDENKEIVWDRSRMALLLSRLHNKGIKVHALDGDPRFALRHWHWHVLATIQAVIHYNKTVQPNERFDGIRYDNEPYILPEFSGVQKESIIEQYLELLSLSKEVTESAGLEFGVDIPFWFDQKNEFFEPIAEINSRPLTECILDIVDNIGIMDYRTSAYGADGVIAHALGELRYASETGKKVFIGLETTALPDETILEFELGQGPSRMYIEKLKGTKVLLHWIPEDTDSDVKSDLYLSQQKKTFVPAGKLTFADRSIGELIDIMEKAESEFQEYPSFYGFAIHYYQSFQKLFKKGR
ncbi:MAG: hypothetical protein JSV17_18055 [Candidatus Aminicenantes bacterium]|nr:MAG: hypothetical protein JSV17_18055 [Candidatus Aminicenantes bacterium]